MTIPSEPRTPRLYHARSGPAFSVLSAVGLVAAGIASFLVASGVVVGAGGPPVVAVVAGELMFVVIAVVGLRMHRLPVAAIGLARPSMRFVGASILIGCSLWYLNLNLLDLLPVPDGSVQVLQNIVDGPHALVALLALAVVPAICEEVMFRGVLVHGLATRFVPTVAVVIGALVFAAYHLSPIQFLPTLTLGLVAGALTVRAHSVVPAMVAHFLNNAIAILVSRNSEASGWIDVHRGPSVAIAGALTAAGIAILIGGRRG